MNDARYPTGESSTCPMCPTDPEFHLGPNKLDAGAGAIGPVGHVVDVPHHGLLSGLFGNPTPASELEQTQTIGAKTEPIPYTKGVCQSLDGNRDVWEIDPTEIPRCEGCGDLCDVMTLADVWKCLRCDPEAEARRRRTATLLADAARIRRRDAGGYADGSSG